ncbi:MAG TPA: peptidoglycan-associated lipoprotein Pal [Candidatus Binatia bacterium]
MTQGAGKFILSSSLLGFLIACGPPANPPPPKWTVQNPSATSGSAPKRAPQTSMLESKPDTGTSSLDALRSGASTAPAGPLKDVYFAFDRAELSEDARATLKNNSGWLKTNASARIQIEGHCDERGAEDYNMALGAKRAQAAMDYLTTAGIPASRIATVSYGEEVPVCKEHSEACWAKNRRARFVIVSGGPAS